MLHSSLLVHSARKGTDLANFKSPAIGLKLLGLLYIYVLSIIQAKKNKKIPQKNPPGHPPQKHPIFQEITKIALTWIKMISF